MLRNRAGGCGCGWVGREEGVLCFMDSELAQGEWKFKICQYTFHLSRGFCLMILFQNLAK